MANQSPLEDIPNRSFPQAIASAILPGLGQVIGGATGRGIAVFLSVATLLGLTIWTSAQRARFPDFAFSANAFIRLFLETGAILLFLQALYYLAARSIAKAPTTQAIARALLILVSIAAIGLVSDQLIQSVVPTGSERELYGLTAVAGAGVVAAMWLWNINDAFRISSEFSPAAMTLILLGSLGLLILGTRVTQIDLPKAVREYQDTKVILRRIVWPWPAAFVYKTNDVTADAKIQAPCPPDANPPAMNEPKENDPWVVVTPNCGEVSIRDQQGKLEFGTLLTIEGGNFRPNENARIQWRNPIGNPFTPRGVGEAEFKTDDSGAFQTKIYVPDVTIPSTALGAQIHTLTVIQSGTPTFTGELSREMQLALQEMLVTIVMGMMATFVGILLALPFSFLAARNLMNSIQSTLEGFIGGVFGLVLGGYLGYLLAGNLSARLGGLQGAPIQTALIHFVLLFGGALLFYQLAGSLLDRLARRALPEIATRAISIIGLGIIGSAIGYFLGRGFASGILGIVYTNEVAAQLAPRSAFIGAVVVGLLLAYQAYRIGPRGEVTTGQFIYIFIRTMLNIIRSIEPLIWALVGIIWVGPGPFAGFIALTLHTIAALGKLYSEAIESIDPGPIEALQATGANRLQTIVYAVVPQVLPPFIAFTIYRWDINVRLSTIIGLVGGGGIGFLLIQWIRQFQYSNAGIAVWLITITVAALDFISAEIRGRTV
ncbi:MAG: ABC transporter permease subunit [Anaerolineales bacterium]